MDLWVVAAAAGAGLVKYWQNSSRDKEGLSEFSADLIGGKSSSEPLLEQLNNNSCPFRRLAPRQIEEEVSSSRKELSAGLDGRVSEMTRLGDSEMASTSGYDDEMLVNYGRLDGYNILSLSSMPPGVSALRNNLDNGKKLKGSGEVGDESSDRLPELCREEIGSFHSFRRSGSSLRSKRPRGFSVKPLNSLESCLVAQLYKEHVEMEEYVFNTFPSPSRPTVRPLVVTDGNRVISRASSDSYSVQLEGGESKFHKNNDFYSDEKQIVLGVPPLPEIGPVERKQKRGKGRVGRLSSSKTKVSGRNFPSQVSSGSTDGMFLFCLGISIGVMSTVIANKKEVNKLNGLLKQTENLVQDLQEELEMKSSLTVKELANEDDESQETNEHSFHNGAPASFSSEQSSLNYDAKTENQKVEPEENSDFMSQIEAELEAELERLEMNMHSSSLEARLSGLELDRDLVGNVVLGELRADLVKGGDGFQAESDRDATGSSTTQTENVNYAVSPRELSLRLHEVIQLRLEEKIMELESELQNSQKRVNLMESKQSNLRRDYSNSEMGSSSQESCTILEEGNTTARPLFLNLAGDALDAYNEVYEEFLRIPGIDEEEELTPVTTSNRNLIDRERIHPLDRSLFSSRNGSEANGSFRHVELIEERDRKLLHDKMKTWERFSSSREPNEVGEFEEENEDEDSDEMGRLLIKQIVEKTRQGSPVVLNAQRLLFSLDDKL